MKNTILSEIRWNAEAGSLAFKDVRYLLIRPETVMQFQQAVEAELGVERAGELFYAGGFAGGSLSGRRYKEALGLTAQQAVEFMCRMGGEIGWGRFEIRALKLGEPKLELDVHNSAFAQAYPQPPANSLRHPVCHLIRGVLGGLMTTLFGREVRASETLCLARGDRCCRFEIDGAA